MDAIAFAAFVESCTWTFAKTMPQNPHEYIVRKNVPESQFADAVVFIREHGRPQVFGGRRYIQYEANGHTYWTMGAPLPITIIINRKAVWETKRMIAVRRDYVREHPVQSGE
jgi:hypothetical protein